MKKFLSILLAFISLNAMSQTDLIISEYVEGWGTNRALELYNPTNKAINLNGYQIVRYSNGKATPPAQDKWKVILPNVEIAAYTTYVIVVDKTDPNGTGFDAPVWGNLAQRADVFLCPNYNESNAMYFSGDDAVTLEKTDGTLVDLFGRWGAPRPAEATMPKSDKKVRCWTDMPPYFNGEGIGITADHTMIRKSNVDNGVTANPAQFNPLAEYDTLPANTFSHLGWHKYDKAPANEAPVFEKEKYLLAIESSAENEVEIGTVKASDKENDKIKYYCEYGNFVYIKKEGEEKSTRIEPFDVNKETGVIKLIDKTGLDKTVKDTFNLKIVATDGHSQTEEILAEIIIDREESSEDSVLVTNITFNKDSIELEVEATEVILATVSPTTATNSNLTWASSDETIATVDNGTVTGLKAGKAIITATANDGSGIKAECFVTVSPKSGVKENSVLEVITLYPNPAVNNQFTVKAQQNIKQIYVYSIVGSKVYGNNNVNKQEAKVYIPKVRSGVYFVNIILQDNNKKTLKIIFE